MSQTPAPNAPARSSPRAVGVIGLGAMGMGVARSLLRKGFEVHACDVREAARQSIASEGAIADAMAAALPTSSAMHRGRHMGRMRARWPYSGTASATVVGPISRLSRLTPSR